MNLRPSNFLGLAVSDRAIACAELSVSAGKRTVRRLATFTLADDLTLDKPDAVGAALATFLRTEHFAASRAVVGLPAKWLIALEKDLPPAAEENARAMLRLQAERLAVSESGGMVFDYAGRNDPARANKVLLVGVPRQRLDQVARLLEAAGLSAIAVTSSALALAKAVGGARQYLPMLLLGRHGAEVVWRPDESPRVLRHVGAVVMNGHGPATVAPLASELGRSLMLTRANGDARELLVWDGVGLSAAQVTELSDRSGFTVRPGDALAMLNLQAAPAAPPDVARAAAARGAAASAETFAPALALALAAADRALLPLDFKRSRLAPRPARRVGNLATWAIVLGVAAVLGTIALYVHVDGLRSELKSLTAAHDGKKADLAAAKVMIDRVTYSRSFFEARPPYLNPLVEITKAFKEYKQIWVTGVSLHENRKGQLQGKAGDQQTVLAVLDRLRKNPKFGDVKLLDVRDAGTRSSEVAFSASFNYIAPE